MPPPAVKSVRQIIYYQYAKIIASSSGCGSKKDLTTEYILPRSCGEEDIPDNVVRICQSCNSSKAGKRLYEWKGLKEKDNHHRIAEGKYLKYLYSLHEKRGTLDVTNVRKLCPHCDMRSSCKRDHTVEKLSVYCLEGCFHK